MKKIIIFVTILAVLVVFGTGIYFLNTQKNLTPVLMPSPSPANPLITVNTPQSGSIIAHAFTITGTARGSWYFEASFPIHIQNAAGTDIASTTARAQEEWMTDAFVPFQATINIPAAYSGPATIVLEKDNPSGLPQNAASIQIPIIVQ
ncbi:MAG: Gmad2 immunoglobulin-like domain-containing protein [Candidatus Andersenbacteria bacterium]